jgi:hypothetical protein
MIPLSTRGRRRRALRQVAISGELVKQPRLHGTNHILLRPWDRNVAHLDRRMLQRYRQPRTGTGRAECLHKRGHCRQIVTTQYRIRKSGERGSVQARVNDRTLRRRPDWCCHRGPVFAETAARGRPGHNRKLLIVPVRMLPAHRVSWSSRANAQLVVFRSTRAAHFVRAQGVVVRPSRVTMFSLVISESMLASCGSWEIDSSVMRGAGASASAKKFTTNRSLLNVPASSDGRRGCSAKG